MIEMRTHDLIVQVGADINTNNAIQYILQL
jgi:hypothetical protein